MQQWMIETAVKAYTVLLPFAWIALAVTVLVLLPMAVWHRTRGAAGVGLIIASYIFGATTWFLGAAVTLGAYGWIGLIFGLAIAGVGVVPIAIFAAFFKFGITSLGVSLCVMLLATFAARFAGVLCSESAERRQYV